MTITGDTPHDRGTEDQAKMTLPDGLVIKESSIPDVGEGAFATRFIPKGQLFCPSDRGIVDAEAINDSGNAWVVSKIHVQYMYH